MENSIKLKSIRLFYDGLNKRSIPQGVMFYGDKDRAAVLIEKGFASIVSEEKMESKTVVTKEFKAPVANKAKAPVKKTTRGKTTKK